MKGVDFGRLIGAQDHVWHHMTSKFPRVAIESDRKARSGDRKGCSSSGLLNLVFDSAQIYAFWTWPVHGC